jgi:hypothetical protein
MTAAQKKRPTNVKVGYIDFMIHYLSDEEWKERDLDEKDGGQMHGAGAEIFVRDAKGQHELHQREILLHEIMHACVYVSGLIFENYRTLEDIEETFIMRTSPVLIDVLKSNPDVTKFILS